MATKPFAAARVGDAASAGYLIANILHASTEYSITGKNLAGTALLWNEGARRLYGNLYRHFDRSTMATAARSIAHLWRNPKWMCIASQ